MKAVYREAPLPPEQVRAWYEADLSKMSEELTGLMVKKIHSCPGHKVLAQDPGKSVKKISDIPRISDG